MFGDPTAPRFVYWEKKLRATPSGPDALTFDLLSIWGKIRAGLGAVGLVKGGPMPGACVDTGAVAWVLAAVCVCEGVFGVGCRAQGWVGGRFRGGVWSGRLLSCLNSHPAAAAALEIARPHSCLVLPVLCTALSAPPPLPSLSTPPHRQGGVCGAVHPPQPG